MIPEKIFLHDKEYKIVCENVKFINSKVVLKPDSISIFLSELSQKNYKEVFLEFLKKFSGNLIKKRTFEMAEVHNFKFNGISIRDQHSRWGSCSSLKNLNFNFRLGLCPKNIMDYVVIHELAHTRQMNHSKDFWNIVEGIIPQFKLSKKWLKENGARIMNII